MPSVSSKPSFLNLIDDAQWTHFSDFSGWAEDDVANTGSSALGVRQLFLTSGGTASSTVSVQTPAVVGWSRGKGPSILDWSQRIVIRAMLYIGDSTTNGVIRFTLGKAAADGLGSPTDKCIGIVINDNALMGLTHEGTNANTEDLSTTLTDDIVYEIMMVSDGAGNVEWFVDGVSVGSRTDGPTGDSTAGHALLQSEVTNGADAAAQSFNIVNLNIYVGQ